VVSGITSPRYVTKYSFYLVLSRINFFLWCVTDCAAVEILADVVQGNALNEKEIEKQKTILLKELEASVIMIWHNSTLTDISLTRALQPIATCHQLPYLRPVPSATKAAIIIVTSFSLWRHSHSSRLQRSQPATKPTILIMTSFATELATSSATDVRADTLPRLMYNDAHCPGDPALAGYFLETGRVIGAESLNGQMPFW